MYKRVARPLFFKIDPETTHNLIVSFGSLLGRTALTRAACRKFLDYEHASLAQDVLGIHFSNPVGLAAGFDYDAKLIKILPSVGFGFHTIGTVTNEAYEGNPPPRLGRLPKSKSLLVNKGFKSAGMEAVLSRVAASPRTVPLGMSIGSTNKSYPSFEDQIQNVVAGFRKAMQANLVDYYELNISCPNLVNVGPDTETFSTGEGFRKLLTALSALEFSKPVFVKMHLEKTEDETAALMDAAAPFRFIKGFVFSNLCKDRSNQVLDRSEVEAAGKGNFSGQPTFEGSNALLRFAYKRHKDRFVLIGTGGIFSAEDAYEKIRAGASLVQLITGMIYEGPQVIGKINRGLFELLKRDGFANVKDAVGADHG